MHKTSNIIVIFVLVSTAIFSQPKIFIGSGFKALESKGGFFISIEPVFEFWQLSASFNFNLMLNSAEKLYSLDVIEKNLGEIFENFNFKLWDLSYEFSNREMKIHESFMTPIESFFLGKISVYSIVHSDFFKLSLKDQNEFFFLDSNIKYPMFSVDIRSSLKKDNTTFGIEFLPKIHISSLGIIPSIRFSSNSVEGVGGFLEYSKNDFKGFAGLSIFTNEETENELGFSNIKNKSLLNFGIEGKHGGGYIGITSKSISTCGFANFENEKIKLYFEPSLIASKDSEKIQITSALFSRLEFSLTEDWALNLSFKIHPKESRLSLGVMYKIYEEKDEGGTKNATTE